MTTGREALHRIDAALADARRALAQASDAAADDGSMIAKIDQQEIDIYRALADLRIDDLQNGDETPGALGEADRKAARLIDQHENRVGALAEERNAAQKEIEALEKARRDAEEAHGDAVARHEDAVADTRENIEKDDAYRARATALEEANAVAARAAQKLEIARNDRKEKGAPYEADPLFSYLWERRFGEKDYRAFPLFALLDRWVAGLIKYRDHKLNYRRLLELPERLEEHAERVDKAAADLENSLAAYEREALEKAGVSKLRDEAAAANRRIEELDAAIAKAEDRHEELARMYAETAAGRAGPMEDARQILAGAFETMSIPDLKILASETQTPEDDRLVQRLIKAKRERMELEEARNSIAADLQRRRRSLSDLETVRRKFKSARFDSPYSEFSGRDAIGALISAFFRGVLSRDELWRRIERAHHTRRREWDDDFGGEDWREGFGLPKNWGGDWSDWTSGDFGGNWGGVPGGSKRKPRRAPRRPRMPRSPRAPRIRFPSGGGRSGGGFKTGGGF